MPAPDFSRKSRVVAWPPCGGTPPRPKSPPAPGHDASALPAGSQASVRQDAKGSGTCLRERATRKAQKRGVLYTRGGRFEFNAAARCSVLMGETSSLPGARHGLWHTSGSIAGAAAAQGETVVLPAAPSR